MTNLGHLGDSAGFEHRATASTPADRSSAIYTQAGRRAQPKTTGRGFLWRDGVMYDLTALVASSGWTIVDARAINDAGQIAATGRQATNRRAIARCC